MKTIFLLLICLTACNTFKPTTQTPDLQTRAQNFQKVTKQAGIELTPFGAHLLKELQEQSDYYRGNVHRDTINSIIARLKKQYNVPDTLPVEQTHWRK